MGDSQDVVLVSGAGPVGLTAALALAQKGISVVVFEASNEPHKEWRASGFHPPTLELLEPLGVVEDMISEGRRIDKPQYRDLELPIVVTTDFSLLKDDTRYPYRLHYEQYKYAALLQRRLEALPNAKILYGHSVRRVETDDNGATAVVDGPDGEQIFTGAWLLGADGSKSAVRRSLNIPFEGYSHEMRYVLLATLFPFEDHLDKLTGSVNFSGPKGTRLRMLLRIPDVWRVMMMVFPNETDEEALDDDRLREQMEPIIGKGHKIDILQKQIYRPHQRVAKTFRDKRVLILGDAAHINSPFGGMGLNGGIHDAIDLTDRLVRVWGDADRADELDTYAERRRTVNLGYVRQFSDEGTKSLWEEGDPEKRRKHLEGLNEIMADPVRHREWLLGRSMIASVRDQGVGT